MYCFVRFCRQIKAHDDVVIGCVAHPLHTSCGYPPSHTHNLDHHHGNVAMADLTELGRFARINSVMHRPPHRQVFTCSWDGLIKLWD